MPYSSMKQLSLQPALHIHTWMKLLFPLINSVALRKAKIVCDFGLSEFSRVKYRLEYFKLIRQSELLA